jgi:methionine synthase II (cobalamin-independent)
MPIPTENVGSLPRPAYLQEAIVAYDAGVIGFDDLAAKQDEACKDSIEKMEATSSPIISDGEQRASSFATYPLTDTLGGKGLSENLAADGQYFAIFDDGHHRQLPRLTSGPFRYKTFASDYLSQSIPYATRPMKQAVIAPSMLSLLYPVDGAIDDYSREQFHDDLCDEAERDIRQAFAAGATHVSIDFTEGRLSCKGDSRNPWTGRNMLAFFIELNNRVIDRFSAEERKVIGVHTCPGGDSDSVHSAEVDYAELLPSLFKLNAGYFLIQVASEADKDHVYRLIGEHLREDADGIAQIAYIGVTDPLNPTVETAEQVRDTLLRASRFVDKHRLGATDDCGFSPFSTDTKPRHGSTDHARDVAFAKIASRVHGAAMASEILGL